jgi:hypothetical protein
MHRRLTISFPKDLDRKYFSKEHQGYANNLCVLVDNKLLFSNIDDAEENLPLTYQADIDLYKTIEITYDIMFGDGTKESASITFEFSDQCHVHVHRPNYLKGSDNLDQYDVTFDINGNIYQIGPEYHQGDSKTLDMQGTLTLPFRARWSTKKSFIGGRYVYWDDTILELT